MAEDKLPTRAEDFAEWYNQLVVRADMADYAPVRGCMVVKPYGWALWENITSWLDAEFKKTGHVNAAFPTLIPLSLFEKEKEKAFMCYLKLGAVYNSQLSQKVLIFENRSAAYIEVREHRSARATQPARQIARRGYQMRERLRPD